MSSTRIEVPGPLHAQVAHGARFGRALDALLEDMDPHDARAVWLVGRSSEVSAFVRDVVREWCAGAVDATRATREIEAYLHSLHRSVRRLFGELFIASCCRKSPARAAIQAAQLSAVRRQLDSSAPTLTQPDGRLLFS
jgi:hypothetical protein